MKKNKYDFSGYATKYNVLCSDSRVILHGAFKHQNGKRVPLCWGHDHNSIITVLGHCDLEEREDGVYAFASFNNTEAGNNARELVEHGDIVSMSIFANHLKQENKRVTYGEIKEVSLVLAGANPQAVIDNVSEIEHSEEQSADIEDFDAFIEMNEECTIDKCVCHEESELESEPDDTNDENQNKTPEEDLSHADKETITQKDLDEAKATYESMPEKFKACCDFLVALAYVDAEIKSKADKSAVKHSDTEDDAATNDGITENTETSKETVAHTETTETTDATVSDKEADDNNCDNKEENEMKHNLFENLKKADGTELTHSDINEAIADGKNHNTLQDSFLAHGITDVGNLFPEVQLVGEAPAIYARETDWAKYVMAKVHKSPFARVKSMFVNITAEEARARGYIKGNQKQNSVMTALKRTTEPKTIYIKQYLDNDDLIDITDYDAVQLMRQELEILSVEEKARAILIGDGRSSDSNDKIDETKIRPVLTDSETYAVHEELVKGNKSDTVFAKEFIAYVRKNRRKYKGKGRPDMFISPALLDDIMNIETTNGEFLYKTEEDVARILRVNSLIPVELFDSQTRLNSEETYSYAPLGIMVNLDDYNVGKDKKADNDWSQFNIDYNKHVYLKETRMSGALVRPYSAMTFELKTAVDSAQQ